MKRILSVIISMCFMIASFNLPVYAEDKVLEPAKDYKTFNMNAKEFETWAKDNLSIFSNNEYPFEMSQLGDGDPMCYCVQLNDQVYLLAWEDENSEYIDMFGLMIYDYNEYKKLDKDDKIFTFAISRIMKNFGFNASDASDIYSEVVDMSKGCKTDNMSYGIHAENHVEYSIRYEEEDGSINCHFLFTPSEFTNNDDFKLSLNYMVYTDKYCS